MIPARNTICLWYNRDAEDADVADGLLQWPGTRGLFRARLGPTALSLSEVDMSSLRERLNGLGIRVDGEIDRTREASADEKAPMP